MPTQRNLKDAALHQEKYLPAAAADNQSPTIDLETVTPGMSVEGMELEIKVPALPNHTDSSKVITLTLQESADDLSYANANPLIQCRVPGVGSTGSAETTFRVRLPSTTKQYIQFTQAVPSGAGDNTAGLVAYDPVF